jgi:hypothetical protein
MQDLQQALGRLKPGTQVSARTDYTVDRSGSLVPDATTVTVSDEQPRRFTLTDERPQRFSDFNRPRATLNPSDEALLFSASEDGQGNAFANLNPQGAQDETGAAIEVEIIAPNAGAVAPAVQAQLQQRASDLYARNSTLSYTMDPVLAFAA